MVVLIAESKTMIYNEEVISSEYFSTHTPTGQKTADEVMSRVAEMSIGDIASCIKVSGSMAIKIKKMAFEFPLKNIGLSAIDAFTGVVYKNLDLKSMNEIQKQRVSKDVRIISSLYGWLKPNDVIKPYRFDYNTSLAPDGKTFTSYWKKDVTIQLVKYLQKTNKTAILNLLPADAAKSVDWKLVKRFAKVWKVDFKEQDGNICRTPNAGKLKSLRGELLRLIITQNINNPEDLLTLNSDNLLALGIPEYPDHITFSV